MICSIQSVDGLRWVEANVLLWSIVNPIHISWVIIWISYIHIYMHTRHVLNGTTFKSIRDFKWQSQFENDVNVSLAMEYFPLGDLNKHVKQNPLAESDAWDITAQLLDALVIMHDQHFTHRDIKPAVSVKLPIPTQTILLTNIRTFLSGGSHPDGG